MESRKRPPLQALAKDLLGALATDLIDTGREKRPRTSPPRASSPRASPPRGKRTRDAGNDDNLPARRKASPYETLASIARRMVHISVVCFRQRAQYEHIFPYVDVAGRIAKVVLKLREEVHVVSVGNRMVARHQTLLVATVDERIVLQQWCHDEAGVREAFKRLERYSPAVARR